ATRGAKHHLMPESSPDFFEPPFEPYRGPEPYLFVTYSHQDKALVFPEIARLHALGVRLWYDEGIDPGSEEWPEEIERALSGAAALIFYITPRSADSKHCRREFLYADQGGQPIIPIFLEPTILTGTLKLQLTV